MSSLHPVPVRNSERMWSNTFGPDVEVALCGRVEALVAVEEVVVMPTGRLEVFLDMPCTKVPSVKSMHQYCFLREFLMITKTILERVYSDFLMPSRLRNYRQLLEYAKESGYDISSISRFWHLSHNGRVLPAGKYLILRNDIDTGLGTAREMWKIAKDIGAFGSYFFRLSTLDVELMQEIELEGGEASYHFEEIATIAKRLKLRTREEVRRHMKEIQAEFAKNLLRLRQVTGLRMATVAAHGDFVNRKLGIPNQELLGDASFRKSTGIELEAYDEDFEKYVGKRCSDTGPPHWWRPSSPEEAIEEGTTIISVLVHPRQWRKDILDNLVDDTKRLIEGIRLA